MNFSIWRFLLAVGLLSGTCAWPRENLPPNYHEWQAACEKLPLNRSLRGGMPPPELLPLPKFSDFEVILDRFLQESGKGPLAAKTNWVGDFPDEAFFDPAKAYFLKTARFQPFAQALNLPAGSTVFLRGDLHGDIHSLMANLKWLNEQSYLSGFQIVRTNFQMVFLGDYTDRGKYGVEVLYTLLRLKVENPEKIVLLRGNHEEVTLQGRYGFFQEGTAKYPGAFNVNKVGRISDYLPVVLYLGTGENLVQCNHGGMEPGYDPSGLLESVPAARFQLLGSLKQREFLASHPRWLGQADRASRDLAARVLRDFTPAEPTSPTVLGFMWNDFTVVEGEPEFGFDPGRAFVYGQNATRYLLEQGGTPARKVQAVFRGHQHSPVLNPIMRRLVASGGVFQHWHPNDSQTRLNAPVADLRIIFGNDKPRPIAPGSVWTFNVGADSLYGAGCKFDFDAFGILTTATAFQDWRVQVVNLPLPAR